MRPQRKTYVKRHTGAIKLLYEALDIIHSDSATSKKLIQDAIDVLNGSQDYDLKILAPKKKWDEGRVERLREFKEQRISNYPKENNLTILKCLKTTCGKIHSVYKIEDKWISKCECGSILIFQGKITNLGTTSSYASFLKQEN